MPKMNKTPHSSNTCSGGGALNSQEKTCIKTSKFTPQKLLILVLSLIFLLGGTLSALLCFFNPNTNAIKTGDTTSFVKVNNGTDLWTGSGINKDTANELFKMLGNSSSADYNTLQSNVTSSSPKSAKTLRGYQYGKSNTQSIVVRLGGLDWIVTYLSVSDVDSDGDGNNDIIATLWLSNNVQDAWSGKNQSVGKYYGFVNGGLYADWSADWLDDNSPSSYTYPSNMYATSYMATVVLNNGRHYATGTSTAVAASTDSSGYGSNNPFYSFTTPVSGARNDLTDFMVTPNNVSWQKTIQDKSLMNRSYNYNNESLSNTGGTYYSSDYNYGSKTNYADWGDDYLWLPSLNETGRSDNYDGIWETLTSERMTYDGSTTDISASTLGTSQVNYSSIAYNYAWVRSACDSNSYNAYNLSPSGANYSNNNVSFSRAVRPSLHLNLKSVYECLPKYETVTLDQQSGTGGTTSVDAYFNEPMPSITLPTRSGFAFGGYFSSTNGTGTKYYNADRTSAINYPAENGPTTLYAYWIPLYTITTTSQNSNLGTTFGSGTYQQGTSLTIFAVPKSGYAFLYWQVSINGGTATQNTANPLNTTATANTTYTAVFGKGIEGILVTSTYGGTATIVGDNFESLSNSDTITLVATVCVTGYQFKHWINQDGTILASGEDNKTYLIPKSQAMDSIITAVFEPIT